MFNQPHSSQTTETMQTGTSVSKTGTTQTGNLSCNGLTTSDQDLRRTKNELFSKLIERQPQQMLDTNTPNKTISDENLSDSIRASKVISHSHKNQFVCQKTSSSDLTIDHRGAFTTNHSRISDLEMSRPLQEPVLFSRIRSRWYTNDEVASILTNFSYHPEWQTNELHVRPQSGAVLLYSREKVRYRQDGYCWKKRKNGRTTREDHMKLKVQGIECIYGCYVHSALLPTFHRRCYWLLENPDIVLVHYLNQPPDDKSKMMVTFNSSVIEADTRRRWTNEEIIEEIGSVFGGISQIHRTLSINLPTVGDNPAFSEQQQQQMSLVQMGAGCSGNTDQSNLTQQQQQQQQQQNHQQQHNPPDSNCDIRGMITSEGELLVMLPEDGVVGQQSPTSLERSMNYSMQEEEEEGEEDDENEQNADEKGMFSTPNNNNICSSGANSNTGNRNNDGDNNHGSNNIISRGNDDSMIATNQGSQRPNDYQHLVGIESNGTIKYESVTEGSSTSQPITTTTPVATTNDLNSTTERDQANNPMANHNPCSPVTQIYNKIVDDIETYVLPLDMDQYEPGQHLHHHHHHSVSPPGVQLMDTGELDEPPPQQHNDMPASQNYQSITGGDHQHQHHHHHEVSLKQEQSDMSPVELLTCDLFANCSSFGDEIQPRAGESHPGLQQQRRHHSSNDMLLTDFNLQHTDPGAGQVTSDDLGQNSMSNVDDMRDLMMVGISSSGDQSNETTNQQSTNQLLLGCDTTDALELFDFKHLSGEHEFRHQNQLDVKSTTSDTDTLNRLSPIISLVPRCNSTDNAMQASYVQRITDNHHHNQHQQQHHASSQFLANFAPLSAAADHNQNNDDHLIQSSFGEYESHHHAIGGVHRSATTTSTEQSNSTSCSASPSTLSLINATSGIGVGASQSGGAYINGDSCGGSGAGGASHLPSTTYHDASTHSSFMKLPLQQRQNSEQKEPSNSVLSSLLPKALSLDGSDLSSTSHRRYHNYHHQHHNLHHHHHHANRTSPLIGSYHRGGASSRHASTYSGPTCSGGGGGGGGAPISQTSNHMLLIPSSQQPDGGGGNGRHYYQRPSAPSLSPSSGNYSLDSSSSCGSGRVFANGIQFRSGSVVAATANTGISHHGHQLFGGQQQQQQQQSVVECTRLRTPLASYARLLPILDYVPNWSRSPGGTKVLLIGNWAGLLSDLQKSHSNNSVDSLEQQLSNDPRPKSEGFSVLFDDLITPASLIQDNVLRCYSPSREPGFIALKVLYKNLIVSEQVLFEIRAVEVETATAAIAAVAPVAQQQQQQQSTSLPAKNDDHLASIK